MKLNLLLLSTIFLLLGMINISCKNSINVEYQAICSVGITNDYDTGTFYQIEPGIDDQFIETYDAGEMRAPNIKSQCVILRYPFEGDTYVANKSFLTSYYSHFLLHTNQPIEGILKVSSVHISVKREATFQKISIFKN